DQLTSIDAGAVLADVAAGGRTADGHVHLTHTFRFGSESGIFEVARAVEQGESDAVIGSLDGRHDDVRRVDGSGDQLDADVWARIVARARSLQDLARSGADPSDVLTAADAFRVLAPLRRGPHGVDTLNRRIAAALDDRIDRLGPHPVGTPLIVTRNDHVQRLYNGDVGVVVADPTRGSGVVAFWAPGGGVRLVAASRLPPHEPVHAMSVHRSQGSQFDEVVVVLPRVDTPLLTRELVYTAITRARRDATIHGDPDILRGAIERRVQRASGLRERLQA
ncbi:MAG: ATP-binding domain-containing protein, partial [Nitriliruptoraceae bacterium]